LKKKSSPIFKKKSIPKIYIFCKVLLVENSFFGWIYENYSNRFRSNLLLINPKPFLKNKKLPLFIHKKKKSKIRKKKELKMAKSQFLTCVWNIPGRACGNITRGTKMPRQPPSCT
jgi:hypothetical protein